MMTTTETVKKYLGIESDEHDDVIEKIIEGVSALFKTLTKREFEYKERTETIDGKGSEMIFLREYPVREITEIKENGKEIDSGYFKADKLSGIIYRKNAVWPEGDQNIEVKYKAGYKMPSDNENEGEEGVEILPADLELATIKQAGKIFEKRHSEGISSASPGGISIAFKDEMAAEVKNTIILYKNINV